MSSPYQIPDMSLEELLSDSDSESKGSVISPKTSGKQLTKKRAGRKTLPLDSENKRIARNRRAQRMFRERKEAHLQDLETKVKSQAARIEELIQTNQKLVDELSKSRISNLNTSTSPPKHSTTTISFNSFPFPSPDVVISPPIDNLDSYPLQPHQQQNQQILFPVSSPFIHINQFDDLGLNCLSVPNTPFPIASPNHMQLNSSADSLTHQDSLMMDNYLNSFLMAQMSSNDPYSLM
ncbi:UNVERIFIED_CONTAM: hypothetical protein HDU68_004432 [Siphonaria sp. JEL0065]|nr:hypothetical protein HDU68_004432 [Siphonaria sp. JEL0065]